VTGALVGLGSVQQQRAAALGRPLVGDSIWHTSLPSYYTGVTVNERVPPGHMGRSPERRQSVQERFQIVPWPWKGAALYVTVHWTGKRR
jgi:hypothetical protein